MWLCGLKLMVAREANLKIFHIGVAGSIFKMVRFVCLALLTLFGSSDSCDSL